MREEKRASEWPELTIEFCDGLYFVDDEPDPNSFPTERYLPAESIERVIEELENEAIPPAAAPTLEWAILVVRSLIDSKEGKDG